MSSFHDWLKTAWTDLLHWFGVEEQKLASFLYPIIKDGAKLAENDLLHDVIDGIPVVAAALAGGLPAALTAAEEFLLPVLTKQGVELEQTTIKAISAGMVAQAQASLASVAPSPAPAA